MNNNMDPGDMPALAPPPGVTPNFIDPPSRSYLVVLTVTIGLTLSSLLVSARIYVNLIRARRYQIDDAACVLAWLGFIAYSALYIVLNRYGSFIDEWNLHVDEVEKWGEYAADAEVVYSILIFLTKLSILLLYKRIFLGNRDRRSKVYWGIHGVLWFNVLFYTANTFGEIFYCTPRQKAWIPSTPGHCLNVYILIITSAAINAFSDIVMIVIPLCVIWNLRLDRRRKIGVSIVFMFGLFSLACGITRTVSSVIGAKSPNQTVALMTIALWAYGEIASGLVASCMPVMPQFFHIVFPKAFSDASDETAFTSTAARNESSYKAKEAWRAKMLNSFAHRKQQQASRDSTDLATTNYIELEDVPESNSDANYANSLFKRPRDTYVMRTGGEKTGITVTTDVYMNSEPRDHL